MVDPNEHYADEQTLAVLVSTIRSMATEKFAGDKAICDKVKLPGEDTGAKALLEEELALLNQRIYELQCRADAKTTIARLETLGEVGMPPEESSDAVSKSKKSPPTLAYQCPLEDSIFNIGANLTIETLEGLKSHIEDQSKLLEEQRVELSSVNRQLLEQKRVQEKALRVLEKDTNVATLTRELRKHQKANEAFQRALREIGEIVTAVARGDLSKKAKLNSVEMDPEITAFKRTINTMMVQLQLFASEVSRVAREVGTEGILGGQARIDGVDGTWKELTDNGEVPRCIVQFRFICPTSNGPVFGVQ